MITDQDLNNPRFRELYMKYLGVLKLLGETNAYLRHNDLSRELTECIEMAFDDATPYLKGRIRVRRILDLYELVPVGFDEADEEEEALQ